MQNLNVLFLVVLIYYSSAVKFRRQLKAAGSSHFKILLSLGSCKETKIFSEQKVWTSIRINRVLDIYYKSLDDDIKVSRVEIYVVVNRSEVLATSNAGVGSSAFSASVFLPADSFIVFYSLQIFTCNQPTNPENIGAVEDEPLNFFHSSRIE